MRKNGTVQNKQSYTKVSALKPVPLFSVATENDQIQGPYFGPFFYLEYKHAVCRLTGRYHATVICKVVGKKCNITADPVITVKHQPDFKIR